ncbi:FAD-dependent oxidoreductase [Bradyrhizobium sp. CNPSo 4010]|uniref:FAD-dependent oxidoreductase n=1 Tax=Bradyrhizobium agreste TaxID=2751811 RepID=A0ABS0PHB0_9BRAD|nr:FAD-dependent oxidoreductase [Bradyrhizobium agreste]MBH5396259.1 FAD-dependent oxidoreductase [Bradyrhizobium agreste]
MTRTIIVGAGQAGRRTAELLRGLDSEREILLVGNETDLPYDRPPLSKEILLGEEQPRGLMQRSHDAFAAQRIDLRLGTHIARLNATAAHVETQTGDLIPYDSLVIATGARARTLPLPIASDPRVLTLRSLADARALRGHLRLGLRLAVMGAGLIGLEVAAAAARQGCLVTVLELADRVMARCVPSRISARIESWHRAADVQLRLSCPVRDVRAERDCLRIATDTDDIEVDLLLVAIGAVPNTELAQETGVAVQDGILADECGRTSAPSIFAAGEVARILQPSGHYKRFETWQVAQYQPISVAHAICGVDKPYLDLPWHWTDQYKHNVQIIGDCGLGLEWLEREDAEGRLAALGVDPDGRLQAAILIDNGREVTPLRRLIMANRPIPRERLLDAALSFKQLHVA